MLSRTIILVSVFAMVSISSQVESLSVARRHVSLSKMHSMTSSAISITRGSSRRLHSSTHDLNIDGYQGVVMRASSDDHDAELPPEPSNEGRMMGKEDQKNDENEQDEDEEEFVYIATKVPTAESPSWEMGNDFDQFLNQRTAQTFLFLLESCRDPHTVTYIEKLSQPILSAAPQIPEGLPMGGKGSSKFLNYHGLAAMNTTAFSTWESYYQTLLEQPVEQYVIESDLAHIPSYEMEVNPPSLCTRMISVREQIAGELVRDLNVLAHMGDDFMLAYWDGVKNGDGDPFRTGVSAHLLFLDAEHAYNPSALRKGNFDLVSLMATQESIHRILNNPRDEKTLSRGDRQYLSNFYLQRLVSHFSNRQPYGRSTYFLLELLQSTPVVSASTESIVDPIRIAEQILATRSEVALEWRDRAKDVPNLHVEIKRLQLNLLMKSYDTSPDAFQ